MHGIIALLRERGIQPTPQRIAVAQYVLASRSHPTADEVWAQVHPTCPTLSRATVYNTLNLMARKGLLKVQNVRNDAVVFDANVERHHHFIDEETGAVRDVPWDAVTVTGQQQLEDLEVREYEVIMRGRVRGR